ncbi:hypothetical protein [uncultured Lactobacillus sp.]|uniref:hypothetical protein n=1 Tax=uncultured Lactobacillus sp. TaxID=153152 RepID=UPI0025FE911D|nr:hypothetical protein [uncultured Lactobacillus sp.]
MSGITTLVLGTKTKLKQETALSEPNPAITPNKDNFINKWRLVGNDREPQLTTKDLLQKTQDGTLISGHTLGKRKLHRQIITTALIPISFKHLFPLKLVTR